MGDAERVVFHRSAAKPFQAVPLADDKVAERFGLTSEELAPCCSSLNGEPEHESLAQSILSKAGLDEPSVTNTLGDDVGVIRADFRLERHG